MGTLDEYDPTPAVEYWMAKRNRRQKVDIKERQQEWFKGVFKEASISDNRSRNTKKQF